MVIAGIPVGGNIMGLHQRNPRLLASPDTIDKLSGTIKRGDSSSLACGAELSKCS